MILALAGNQNCGKTTLFNQLTGSNQHVGNFPGVTVEQKSGQVRGQKNCSVVDLARHLLPAAVYGRRDRDARLISCGQKPDGIINIVDATNLERNLYLTLQLLTLRVPTVLALNMMDELTGNGGSIDVQENGADARHSGRPDLRGDGRRRVGAGGRGGARGGREDFAAGV